MSKGLNIKTHGRPESNKDYKILNRKTGKWELVKGKPTEPAKKPEYSYRAGFKHTGYWESIDALLKKIAKRKKQCVRKRQYI